MTLDLKQLRADADGFRGRFFYDAERGDIGYIAKDCDDKQCDCEKKLNADGDQDCSHSLDDWQGEDHLCEPLARMLNAVGPLLDGVEYLERRSEQLDIVRDQVVAENETLRRELEEVRAANEQAASTFRQRIDRLAERAQANEDAWRVAITERDSARAEVERLKGELATALQRGFDIAYENADISEHDGWHKHDPRIDWSLAEEILDKAKGGS